MVQAHLGPASWLRRSIIPAGIVLGLAYLNFACNYSLGYKEIYQHHSHASAILLWIVNGFSQVCIFVYWYLTVAVGPGKSPQFPAFNIHNELESAHAQYMPVPHLFFCDESGYPYYDSNTQSIKLERTFYSKHVGYNVLKYDHYCLWIGTVVGLTNYLYFFKFCIWLLTFFATMLVWTAVYTHPSIRRRGVINHNFIVVYVMCGLWLLMIGALVASHVVYVCFNMTTLDDLTKKQRRRYQNWQSRRGGGESSKPSEPKLGCIRPRLPRQENGARFVNVEHGETRVVVRFDVNDLPFDLGWKRNWINLVLNGNRSRGRSESFYTTARFTRSVVVLLVPFVELLWRSPPTSMMMKRSNLAEAGASYLESMSSQWEYYSEELSPRFLEMIQLRISKGDCHSPSYLVNKESLQETV
ncbi:uncharacterized protein LODBEIA_P56700 [Lodderomyces beijingensis]|uniref:Palmitoyltransferase n=1 Tax=Lodderomyces beijingensis TaxID=1775926 RepID=A0ABP0ZVW1_9ASCO